MTSDVMQAALKPCPFCGGNAKVDDEESDDVGGYFASCTKCPVSAWGDTREEAVAAWNTRLTAQSGEGRSAVSAPDAFDMGFAFGMAMRGQTLEDSRAVGRLLLSDTFKAIHPQIRRATDALGFDSFQSADHGMCQAKRIIRAALSEGEGRSGAVAYRVRRQTIGAKVEHVRAEIAADAGEHRHHCHWPGCDEDVPPATWGCKRHWYMLPKSLRDRIWATYRPGQELTKTPSRDYVAVAREVQRWIEANHPPEKTLFG